MKTESLNQVALLLQKRQKLETRLRLLGLMIIVTLVSYMAGFPYFYVTALPILFLLVILPNLVTRIISFFTRCTAFFGKILLITTLTIIWGLILTPTAWLWRKTRQNKTNISQTTTSTFMPSESFTKKSLENLW
jgi:hypothetical protein